MFVGLVYFIFFFFNDTATTEIYTLSLHDALPILKSGAWERQSSAPSCAARATLKAPVRRPDCIGLYTIDRKSTRLNSSHGYISYAVFCLKKKNQMMRVTACRIKFIMYLGRAHMHT